MSKTTRILLAIGLILAVATPALAEFKFSGFYQTMFYDQQLKQNGTPASPSSYKDPENQRFVDQRVRFRPVYTLNDNVAIVYQGEIDTVWGSVDKNSYNNGASTGPVQAGGGRYDTDGINVETKNIFLDLKYQDTTAQIGLINLSDEFQGLIYGGADMAGILATQKFGNTSIKFLYSKWNENTNDSTNINLVAVPSGAGTLGSAQWAEWDDQDFYGLAITQKFSDAFSAGLAGYWVDNNQAASYFGTSANANADGVSQNLYYIGPYASFTSGNFAVNGFVLYQTGKLKYDYAGPDDVDSEAWAASAKGTYKLENGDVNLRLIYISNDDDEDDNQAWQGNNSQYDFVNENQMIFLTDKFVANAQKERYAIYDSANTGYGLMAAVLSGNHKLPDAMFLNWGLGYYSAVDDERNDESSKSREGKTLGYEACVRFGKTFLEKVDVSVNAAYAGFGSFYDNTVDGGDDDPDAIYKAYLMVRVPF